MSQNDGMTLQHKLKTELDEITVTFFDNLDRICLLQAQLNDEMASGFWNMSRSRYKMGVKLVDINQFDVDKLTALYKIDESDDILEIFRSLPDELILSTKPVEDTDIRQRKSDKSSEERYKSSSNDEDADGVMNKLNDMNIHDNSNNLSQSLLAKHIESKVTKQDPINFFGILVPQTLRDCQSCFARVLKLSVDLSNEKNNLMKLYKEFKDLKKQLEFTQ